MIDLHTHILPDWDDGASDRTEAVRMIEMAKEDGISKICLTPHVFRQTKHGNGARGLKGRIHKFLKTSNGNGIEFFSGAEVHVQPDIISRIREHNLTINGSNYVFIEFPAEDLPRGATDLVYRLLLDGFIPIVCHPERNAVFVRSPEILYEMVGQGALGQITSKSVIGGYGHKTQKAAEIFLRHGLAHLIASDAHNTNGRPPLLSKAVDTAAKWMGRVKAEALVTTVPEAILKNEHIPDLGEPLYPKRKGRLHLLFS
jgi:protein-tyrosine phosphatase